MTPTGILPVITTPFLDGRFDPDSFDRLLDHFLEHTDGYTLLGSTGEAPSLAVEERMRICEHALARTPAGKTVVVGVTHTSVDVSIRLARHAQEHGAGGVLCASPFYFANSHDGLLAHFAALDRALEIDLILYDNPAATRTTLPAAWVVEWSRRLEHLRAAKLTDHDLAKVAVWREAGLVVFGGDDPILFRYLAAGVDGVMMIVPSLFPGSFRAAWDAVQQGDQDEGLAIFSREVLPFSHVFGIGDEIATTKALLASLAIYRSDEVLPPLTTVDPERARLLRAAHALCTSAAARRL